MSDFWTPPPQPEVSSACPGCEPTADPRTYVTYWCGSHEPDRGGVADHVVEGGPHDLNTEGGTDGKAWCDFIHRGKR